MLALNGDPKVYSRQGKGVGGLPSVVNGVWYIGCVKPQLQKRTAHELAARAVSYFCPMQRRESSDAGRVIWRMELVLPGFIFFNVTTAGYHAARDTHRFWQVMPVKDQKGLVSDLQRISRALRALTFDRFAKIQAGKRVRVISGPFKGEEGRVDFRNGTRIALDVRPLGAASFIIEAERLEVIP